MDIKEKIINVLCESIKPRTLIAYMFYGAFIYMVLRQVQIPEPLKDIVNMLLGYWFGSRIAKNSGGQQ